MFHRTSQRTNSKFKPKWPRLSFLHKKRDDDLRFWVDEDYLVHVVPKSK